MNVFQNYANFYDILYREKNYAGECDFLEEIFRRYATQPIRSILELGCGTGSHALLMTKRGYDVTGIDLSEKMLKQAREKAIKENLAINFHLGDVRNFSLNKKFDALIAMFTVIGYQTTNHDVENTLKTARNHLNPDGLLIFDVWFGPAVFIQQPADRVKVIKLQNEKIIRMAHPVMDIINHIVQVNYTVMRISGDRILEETNETHVMRYFFPQEATYFLNQTGFEVQQISPFMDLGREVSTEDWNIIVVAKAI